MEDSLTSEVALALNGQAQSKVRKTECIHRSPRRSFAKSRRTERPNCDSQQVWELVEAPCLGVEVVRFSEFSGFVRGRPDSLSSVFPQGVGSVSCTYIQIQL